MVEQFKTIITPYQLERTIHLYLPDDYYTSVERYPVMYMYDGHNLFYDEEATYGKSWGLKSFLDHYNKKFIIVGIECNHEGRKRLDEFCPYTLPNSFLGDINGTGKELMNWVVSELKPYIDMHYRTYSNRECTGIGGSSMGGLMALYTIIHHNDIFSKAACLSSSALLCFEELREEYRNASINPDTRVYFGFGKNEVRSKKQLNFVTSFHYELCGFFFNHHANAFFNLTNGKHNEASWEKENPVYFNYLWQPVNK